MFDFFSHLSISRKFLIVSLLTLPTFVVPTVMLMRSDLAAITTARTESDGMARAAHALRLIQLTQHHRALSAGMLGGIADMAAPREAKQAELDGALAKVAADAASEPAVAARIADVQTRWRALGADVAGKRIDTARSTARHTDLVQQQMDVLQLVIDGARLSMDSEPGTHHALRAVLEQLPQLTESLGQARALGAALLQRHEANEQDRAQLAGLAGVARMRQTDIRYAFEQFAQVDAGHAHAIGSTVAAALEAADQAARLLDERIVQSAALDFAPADYIAQMTRAIDSQFALMDTTFKLLDGVLAARVSAHERELVLTAAAIVAFGALAVGLGLLVIRRTTRAIGHALTMARAVAQGDLTTTITAESRDEIGQLLAALGSMNQSLARVVNEVRNASESIATGSTQVATGSADLSQRTEEQAANLQQTAASMEELGTTVRNNASTARQAAEVVGAASGAARRGGEVVAQVVGTMDEITASSKKIADIIGIIDGIAFQTNILALNAAVEAARAGDQGRGFAVVASEVRSLAQRSAAAAREIKALIAASGERVEAGSRLVSGAGTAMSDIVEQVARVHTLIAEISDASQQQASGIGQVGDAVNQLDGVTQQNAALVEESAAAADSLSQQAARLLQAVGVFRLARA